MNVGNGLKENPNIEIKAFVKGDKSPFKEMNFSNINIYELTDYTLRTPLEKMDIFSELLTLPHQCELWILPVTEAASSLLSELPRDETYEKTAELFSMLSAVKETIERDRTFLISKKQQCDQLVDKLTELGFTLTKRTKEEVAGIELSK